MTVTLHPQGIHSSKKSPLFKQAGKIYLAPSEPSIQPLSIESGKKTSLLFILGHAGVFLYQANNNTLRIMYKQYRTSLVIFVKLPTYAKHNYSTVVKLRKARSTTGFK